jgi:hypothetical protein
MAASEQLKSTGMFRVMTAQGESWHSLHGESLEDAQTGLARVSLQHTTDLVLQGQTMVHEAYGDVESMGGE